MIQQVIFDNVELVSIQEKNYILLNYMNNIMSIDEISKELGIDRLIIRKFISDYEKRARGIK